jgi:hypothetical protein
MADEVDELRKACRCLFITVDAFLARDVTAKAEAVIAQLDAAIEAERERAARIAESHSATDCNGPDCGVVIAAAIRNQEAK